MILKITYGQKTLPVTLPEANCAGVIRPAAQNNSGNKRVDLSAFKAFVQGEAPVLFIVNDGSRPTPTAAVLKQLYPVLPKKNITFLIATGSHRAPSESELHFIFGELLSEFRKNLIVHDATEPSALDYQGQTSRGTPVYLNSHLSRHEKIVVIGSVEPHYFAGYTGGRKAFLPGIAGYDSIEHNHKLALEQGAFPLQLKGNPVHEDQAEVLNFLKHKQIFSIMTVLDIEDRIHALFNGDIETSFAEAVSVCRNYYSVPVSEKADVLIAVAAPPLDATLYQAHKAIENVRSVLKENGKLLLVAPCSEGVGNDTFIRLLQSYETPGNVLDYVDRTYKLGFHKAARLAELSLSSELYLLSELDNDLVSSVFMHPLIDLQSLIDSEIRKKANCRIMIVEKATVVIPVFKK